MMKMFPRTKLLSPRLDDQMVGRPELVARIARAAISRRLTLLAAPAGSGKTTMAAKAIEALPETRCAWLRLDEEDNDLFRFIMVWIEAFNSISPTCVQSTNQLLAELPSPEPKLISLMGVLINDLLDGDHQAILLVLDDLHLIENPEVYQALDYFLEHLPHHVHLLATTRYEPPLAIARLRARGQLGHFQWSDLCFNEEETATLINDQMQLQLSAEELQLLHSQTEGWVTGLRLLAASIPQQLSGNRLEFLAELGKSSRHLFDLLAEEALLQQTPELQQFLLDTSILSELTPQICRKVSGRADAPELLDTLYRRNLFLIALEGEQAVFRYHDLFSVFLRQKLQQKHDSEYVKQLYQRAAEASNPQEEAIPYYLAAENWSAVAEIITDMGKQQLARGYVQLPSPWLQSYPKEIVAKNPWLQLLQGVSLVQKGQMVKAHPMLETARSAFQTAEEDAGLGFTLVALGQTYMSMGQFFEATEVAHQLQVKARSPQQKVGACLIRLWSANYRQDWQETDEAFGLALHTVRTSTNPGATQLLAQGVSPELLFGAVDVDQVEYDCRTILKQSP